MLSANPIPGGCWPTPDQELLLGAALHPDREQAAECWTEWFRRTAAENLDEGSFRLLPLLVHNLRRVGLDDPFFGRLDGVHRKMWVETRRMLHEARRPLELLIASGIPVMVTKGAPLALSVYPDVGRRPMRDLDLLVPQEHFQDALAALACDGWRLLTWTPPGLPRDYFAFRHGVALRNVAEREIDLHWHLLYWACSQQADTQFWEAAEPFDFYGLPVRRPSGADQLLQLCVHGLEWNEIPPIRWIADAILLLRASPAIDWDRILRLAVNLRLVLPLRAAFGYLQERFDAPVPAKVLDRFQHEPVTPAECREFLRYTKPFPQTPGVGYVVTRTLDRWLRARRQSQSLTPWAMLRFIQYHYRHENLLQLASHLARYPGRAFHRRRLRGRIQGKMHGEESA